MLHCPTEFGAFEFVVLSSLRAAQLMHGSTPRVVSSHKKIMTAQLEIANGLVVGEARPVPVLPTGPMARRRIS